MNPYRRAFLDVLHSSENAARAAGRPDGVRVLAISKSRTAEEVAALATLGQQAFGENYVQEAAAKIAALAGRGLEWHLVGHLQSNKAGEAARLFDWVQSVDRSRLVSALARHRPSHLPPLNVLLQVNIDDEASKHGCSLQDIPALAATVAAEPNLALRGLMAIPAPFADPERRREAFAGMCGLFERMRATHPQADTLSMGMSDDFALAIAEGATMVRIGSALFGPRRTKETT